MALTPCPRCGKMISDKAERCPQCGLDVKNINSAQNPQNQQNISRPTIIDRPLQQGRPTIIEEPSQDEHPTIIEHPKKSKKALWICLCIILAVGIGAAIWIPIHRHNEKLKAEKLSRLVQHRLDSIAAEEAEIVGLEKIRPDSIKDEEAKNFITNDLRLFELHGHVKSVSNYLPLDDGQIFDGNNGSDIYFFNKDGECRKRSEVFKGFVYDGDKRIIKAQYNDNDYNSLELKWNNNGELAGINYDIYAFSCNIRYDYNSNGDLIKTFQETSARGVDSETIFIYDIIERDKYDNWIKRRVRQTSKLISTYEDGPLEKPEINTKEKFEERIIEYYED